ncbi:MAG: hypothetical protein WBM31_08105, partial [Pseudolabrys sp.]
FSKIHERRSLAMKFAQAAVSQTTIRAGVAVAPLSRLTQRVGVSRISTLKNFVGVAKKPK